MTIAFYKDTGFRSKAASGHIGDTLVTVWELMKC